MLHLGADGGLHAAGGLGQGHGGPPHNSVPAPVHDVGDQGSWPLLPCGHQVVPQPGQPLRLPGLLPAAQHICARGLLSEGRSCLQPAEWRRQCPSLPESATPPALPAHSCVRHVSTPPVESDPRPRCGWVNKMGHGQRPLPVPGSGTCPASLAPRLPSTSAQVQLHLPGAAGWQDRARLTRPGWQTREVVMAVWS